MPKLLKASDKNFAREFSDFLNRSSDCENNVGQVVGNIVLDIQKRKDAALFEYTRKFDKWDIDTNSIKVTEKEINAALNDVSKEVVDALETAVERVAEYHKHQLPDDFEFKDKEGFRLGWKWNAVESVGLYVPGGTAAYPSSVIMNAIPAKVAGVKRIAMVTPAKEGRVNSAILVASKICGLTEIYKVGGAQSVAALAFGTESVSRVVKIVGPGNAYVAEAKRQVFGVVGIDTIAGPTDVAIIADKTANPAWVAADLLAQAEHDVEASSVLITDSEELANSVVVEVYKQLQGLPRHEIASASWENNGAIIIVPDIQEAAIIANQIAPEHLEIITEQPEKIADKIINAGAIFIGAYSVEAIGDYIAGPSHVLPTAGAAKFSSGLSVYDFIKKSSIISSSAEAVRKIGGKAVALAESEGLQAHARSISFRLEGK